MKFVERVIGKLSDGHNNSNKKDYKNNVDKYHKYTSREYSEYCQADSRRNLVIWSR